MLAPMIVFAFLVPFAVYPFPALHESPLCWFKTRSDSSSGSLCCSRFSHQKQGRNYGKGKLSRCIAVWWELLLVYILYIFCIRTIVLTNDSIGIILDIIIIILNVSWPSYLPVELRSMLLTLPQVGEDFNSRKEYSLGMNMHDRCCLKWFDLRDVLTAETLGV
jgi:hypothetical protein